MAAYHSYVELACIAQGLLLYLAITSSDTVWKLFPGWLRTMNPSRSPSELVVAGALRQHLPEFLAASTATTILALFLREQVFARSEPLHHHVAA